MRTPSVSKAALFGAGGGGILCGVALAVALTAGGPEPRAAGRVEAGAPPTEASAAPDPAALEAQAEASARADAEARAKVVEALVVRLHEAHEELHRADEGDAIAQAARAAIATALPGDDEEVVNRRALVTELYGADDVGRFVRGGRLTDLGAAVIERVRDLERHAVDPAPYDRDELEASLAEILPADTKADRKDPIRRAVAAILEAPSFEVARAARKLALLDPTPSVEAVEAIIAELEERGVSGVVRGADVEPDMRLMVALVQLALDFKFVRKAGPFELRKADTVLERKRERAKLVKLMGELLASEDGPVAMARLDPPHPQYEEMLAIHARYLERAEEGCPDLPESWKLRPGMKGDEVKRLQRRLACEGYYAGEIDGVYEGRSLAAAMQYQRHHELNAEGFVFEETIASMNVPMERRAAQIALALQRMRESEIGKMGELFIRVNLPAFELAVWEKGEVIRRQRVIVGTNRLDDDKRKHVQGHLNRTKLFTTELYRIIVHPAWILPPRVEHGELKGKLAEDPDYLDKHNIKQVTLDNGRKVYIQGFGEGNVLGDVKFLLRESNAIYLHDTDKPDLFKHSRRDFSHGCVRVQYAVDFARWLLARAGYTDKEVDRAFKLTHKQRGFDLDEPIDLITEYMTVDISDEGLPVFLTDIYWYDRDYFAGDLPPEVTTLWGSSPLRPRWVPRVSEETVLGWKAAGKPAPRNYDPEIHGK